MDTTPMPSRPGSDPAPPRIDRVGRYRIIRRIGSGSFGEVYLALDERLQRSLAVKVLSRGHETLPSDLTEDDILEEGRLLAQLDHPGIVEVFDTGHDEAGRFFFASQYLEGPTLSERLKQSPLAHRDSALIVAQVADVLAYAHARSVIHRDVKPNNIVLMENSRPVLIDFGIATRSRSGMGRFLGVIGTPGYMSPEQARGESHLVDARSDLFSLGVILFQMLTGKRPFEGSKESLLQTIASHTLDAPPPRKIDPSIPKSLERICRKALAKRPADRYATAADLASDLRGFLNDENIDAARDSTATGVRLIPKGLRSFDAEDVGFFLGLLPGLRDQSGIPDSLRYWLRGITDTDDPFRVGILYGPSGSGKSSFLCAGLLPRLPRTVATIFLRAGTGDLGKMLHTQLLRDIPGLAAEVSRNTFMHRVRRNPVGFLGLGLDRDPSLPAEGALPDEGETTLNALNLPLKKEDASPFPIVEDPPSAAADLSLGDLIRRLREGDLLPAGVRVLIVIDQFEQWLHRQEGGDYQTTELFAALRQCDGHRVQFLLTVRDDFWMAIARLMSDIDVELIQSKNAAGIELFDRSHARHVLRGFGQAYGRFSPDLSPAATASADAFIEMVLDDMEVDGQIMPLQISLFAEIAKSIPWQVGAYRALGGRTAIGIVFLDSIFSRRSSNPAYRAIETPAREILRALLPTGGGTLKEQPIGIAELRQRSACGQDEKRFESIVRVLDEELRLLSPIDSPDGTPGDRRYQLSHDYLVPALREWLNAGEKATLGGRARLRLRELAAAWRVEKDRRHLPTFWEWLRIRLLTPQLRWDTTETELMTVARSLHTQRLALAATVGIFLAMAGLWLAWGRRVEREIGELLILPLPHLLERLKQDHDGLDELHPHLIDRVARGDLPTDARVNAAFLLAGKVPSESRFLFDQCHSLPPEKALAAFARISPLDSDRLAEVRSRILAPRTDASERLRLACLLLQNAPDDPLWRQQGQDLSQWLLSAPVEETALWASSLYPLKDHLLPHLPGSRLHLGAMESTLAHRTTIALATFRRENSDALLGLMEEVNLEDIPIVIRTLRDLDGRFLFRLNEKLAQYLGHAKGGKAVGPTAGRRAARQAVVLLALAEGASDSLGWELLHFQPDPTGRSHLIDLLPHSGLPIETLHARAREDIRPDQREALIQAIGNYPHRDLNRETRTRILKWLVEVHRNEGDPGTHASVEWALRRWGEIVPTLAKPMTSSVEEGRNWFVTRPGPTFTIIEAPRDTDSATQLPGRYGIAQTELTVADFLKSEIQSKWHHDVCPFPECPISGLTKDTVMQYANWLSREEHIPEDQWCYTKDATGAMIPKPGFTRLAGFRMPTWDEWLHAASAGAITEIPYGSGEDLRRTYLVPANRNRTATTYPAQSLRPNRNGLFDVVGNLSEYCHINIHTKPSATMAGGSFAAFVDKLGLDRMDFLSPTFQSAYPIHGYRMAINLDIPKAK